MAWLSYLGKCEKRAPYGKKGLNLGQSCVFYPFGWYNRAEMSGKECEISENKCEMSVKECESSEKMWK